MLYAIAAGFLLTVLWRSFSSWDALGLRTVHLLRSLWIGAAALLLAGAAVLVSLHLHTLHAPATPLAFLERYWGYALWSFFQQLLLQDVFLVRFLRLLPGRPALAALAAASIFAFAHVPSPILTAVTLVWGLIACLLFLHYRNLYPLALSHAIFGICLAITLPGPLTHNMRVGLGYLTYGRGHPHRIHWDHSVSTRAWVVADAPTRRSRRHARPYAIPASAASAT
jgi:hypothetical protein